MPREQPAGIPSPLRAVCPAHVYLLSMALRRILTFNLSPDFHAECGWLSAVRSRCLDAAAANYLRERHPELLNRRDPARVLADWRPVGARMLYYLRQKGEASCQFIATDGIFVHVVHADGPDWHSFRGPVGKLLRRSHECWLSDPTTGEFPLAPRPGGYPGAIIIQDLANGMASIASSDSGCVPSNHQEEKPCLATTS